MDKIVINSVACDYLTLTTFDDSVAARMRSMFCVLQSSNPAKVVNRLQYEGRIADGVFLGAAVQNGTINYMMQATGYDAHRLMQAWQAEQKTDRPRCTRLDLQVTVERLAQDMPLSAYKVDMQIALKEHSTGRPPGIELFDKDGKWGETIYIGSRLSERYIRVYDKEFDGRQGIRFETEYKGGIADNVFSHMLKRDTYSTDVIFSELAKLAGIQLYDRMGKIVKGDHGFLPNVFNAPTTDDSRIVWLENTIWPIIRKMYLSGSHRKRLSVMIAELQQMCDEPPLDNSW